MELPSPSEPHVTILIASRNRPERLRKLLETLRTQTYENWEAVVVDDGSDPPIAAFPAVRQIRMASQVGACRARNAGLEGIQGKYVIVLDDDTEMQDSTLIRRAVGVAESIPNLGALGFRQLTPEGVSHYMQPAAGEKLCPVPTFMGYGALLSRRALDEVGGFFEPLGYYYEENELSLRMVDRGYAVLYDPSLQVTHFEDQKGRNYRTIHRLCWRNTMYTIVARYPAWLIPLALVTSVIRYARLASSYGLKFSDLGWGLQNVWSAFPELLRQRKPVKFRTLKLMRQWRTGVS